MKKVGIIILVLLISSVIGVFVLGPLLNELKENLPEDSPEALITMLDLMPIIFIVIVLVAVVVVLLGSSEEEEEEELLEVGTKEWIYRSGPHRSLKERIEAEEHRR